MKKKTKDGAANKPPKKTRPPRETARAASPAAAIASPEKTSTASTTSAAAVAPTIAPTAPTAASPLKPPPPTASSLVVAAAAAVVAFSAEALRHALGFVLVACPKEGPLALVIFDVDEHGVPLVAAHDRTRCHTAFLPKDATCLALGTVSRASVRKLHRLLGGLDPDDNDTVVVHASGRVEVRRVGQPSLSHTLDFQSFEPGDWRPPPDDAAKPTTAPLMLASEQLQRAVRFPGAVVMIEQRSSARMIVNAERCGELVARAIIAEQGHELYPSAQTTFEFSDSARSTSRAAIPESVKHAADDLRAKLQRRDEEELAAPEAPSASEVAMTFPEPGDKPVVVEIPEALFDELSPEANETLRLPPGVSSPLFWFNLPDRRTSPVLAAETARAVGAACVALGLACADVSAGRRHGVECSVWTVARAASKGGA